MQRNKVLLAAAVVLTLSGFSCKNECSQGAKPKVKNMWSIEQAQKWGKENPWFCGANFNPSSAINQLEMWQAESFDPTTIDRELGMAASIGMNFMRVYLHHVAWQTDKEGFKSRMKQYLDIADKHNIKTMFVFFDDCWNPTYKAGKQPEPKPGVHNSGWLRDPGNLIFLDENLIDTLETYVKDVLATFKDDKRIVMWDLYNEPGNNNLNISSMPLLRKVFQWGWDIRPSQPLTAGVWNKNLHELNKFQVENSDIITYHNYNDEVDHAKAIDTLKQYRRPMICSEYMARRNNSRFQNILPLLKEQRIGAVNWGLVAGKSNTIYAWDTPIPDGSEPKLWFHDIFRMDGTPFDQAEIEVIKSFTRK